MECFIGTYVYNNQSNLPNFFESLDNLLNIFSKIKLIIVYDKSIDNSIEMITNYNNSKIEKVLIDNDNKVVGLARTKRTEHVNNLIFDIFYLIKIIIVFTINFLFFIHAGEPFAPPYRNAYNAFPYPLG